MIFFTANEIIAIFFTANEIIAIFFTANDIQWKPLIIITLGPCKSDYINRLITISGIFYALLLNKWFSEN